MDDANVQGRSAYERRAWGDAYEALSRASAGGPLDADDLERLAFSASLTGREDAAIEASRGWPRVLSGGRAPSSPRRTCRSRAGVLPGE